MCDRKPPFEIKPCIVHPWYLREYNRRWYLFGFDEMEQKIKHYALDRMATLTIKDGIGYKSPDIKIDEILKDVIGVSIPDEQAIDVYFWVSDESADFVSKKLIHHTQKEMTKEEVETYLDRPMEYSGGKFFKMKCKYNYELRREMLSFGPELIVLSPESLKSRLREQLKRMSDIYDK